MLGVNRFGVEVDYVAFSEAVINDFADKKSTIDLNLETHKNDPVVIKLLAEGGKPEAKVFFHHTKQAPGFALGKDCFGCYELITGLDKRPMCEDVFAMYFFVPDRADKIYEGMRQDLVELIENTYCFGVSQAILKKLVL